MFVWVAWRPKSPALWVLWWCLVVVLWVRQPVIFSKLCRVALHVALDPLPESPDLEHILVQFRGVNNYMTFSTPEI